MKFRVIGTILGAMLCACQTPHESASTSMPSKMLDDLPAARPLAAKSGDEHPSTTPAGSVRTVNEPLRPIEGAPSGRVWLLEMYQTAVTQRDEFARRMTDLTRERDADLARAGELEKARADLELRNARLATELQDLQTKSLELARRLAHSELARLDAEKALLVGRTSGAGTDKP
jgi:hypothetical protein